MGTLRLALGMLVLAACAPQQYPGPAAPPVAENVPAARVTKATPREHAPGPKWLDTKGKDSGQALTDFCASTRPEREKDRDEAVAEYREAVSMVRKAIPWMKMHHCKIVDTRGVLVQRFRVPEGSIVRASPGGREEDIVCDTEDHRPVETTAEWWEANLPQTIWENESQCQDVETVTAEDVLSDSPKLAHLQAAPSGPLSP